MFKASKKHGWFFFFPFLSNPSKNGGIIQNKLAHLPFMMVGGDGKWTPFVALQVDSWRSRESWIYVISGLRLTVGWRMKDVWFKHGVEHGVQTIDRRPADFRWPEAFLDKLVHSIKQAAFASVQFSSWWQRVRTGTWEQKNIRNIYLKIKWHRGNDTPRLTSMAYGPGKQLTPPQPQTPCPPSKYLRCWWP